MPSTTPTGRALVGAANHEFVGSWTPIRASPMYVVFLIGIAAFMVVMPLVYLSLVGLVGWGVWWHALNNFPEPDRAIRGRAYVALFGLYAAVIAGGIGIVISLLKPLVARAAPSRLQYVLDPSSEPALHAFVGKLCVFMGAPVPKRIDIDCHVNASASFRGGLLSVFRRGDLVLTIGMPLAAGMNIQQFAGILAHELGHFSQGAAMRATSIIMAIQFWMATAAYGEDAWDVWVRSLRGESESTYGRLCGWVVTIGMVISRMVLRVMLFLSNIVTMAMMRQMEFNADRYEYQMVGSKVFEESCQRMELLMAAFQLADAKAHEMWNKSTPRQVPEDIPTLTAALMQRITPEQREELVRTFKEAQAGLFDSHPPTTARVERARAAGQDGLLRGSAPASTLFSDYQGACRQATYRMMKNRLGGFLYDVNFVPIKGMLAELARDEKRRCGMSAFVGFDPPTWRPLFPESGRLPQAGSLDGRATAARIRKAKQALKQAAPGASAAVSTYRHATERMVRCHQAQAVLEAGLRVDFASMDLTASNRHELDQLKARSIEEAARAVDAIDPALEAAAERLDATLAMLSVRGIERLLPAVDSLRTRTDRLLRVSASLRETLTAAKDVRREVTSAVAVLRATSDDGLNDDIKRVLRPLSDKVGEQLGLVRQKLGEVPAAHDDEYEGRLSLARQLIVNTPGWREMKEIFQTGDTFVERFVEQATAVVSELIEIAVKVEETLKAAQIAPTIEDKGKPSP